MCKQMRQNGMNKMERGMDTEIKMSSRCTAQTAKGSRCKNRVSVGEEVCGCHRESWDGSPTKSPKGKGKIRTSASPARPAMLGGETALLVSSLCHRSDDVYPCVDPIPKRNGGKGSSYPSWTILSFIDSGSYGKIYIVSDSTSDNPENLILKVYRANDASELRSEVCLQHRAAKHGLAPAILDYWGCEEALTGVIIMKKAGNMSFKGLYTRYLSKTIVTRNDLWEVLQIYRAFLLIWKKTLKLNIEAQILHLDLHNNNIMVTIDQDEKTVTDVQFIDFGKSKTMEEIDQIIIEDVFRKKSLPKQSSLSRSPSSRSPSRTTSASIIMRFNELQRAIKYLYADRYLPLEFFQESIREIKDMKTSSIYSYIYQQLRTISPNDGLLKLMGTSWYPVKKGVPEDIDLFVDANDSIKPDLVDFLGKEFPSIFENEDEIETFVDELLDPVFQ